MSLMDGRGRWSRHDAKSRVGDYLRLDAHALARRFDLTKPGRGGWRWSWSTPLGGERSASIKFWVVPDTGIELDYMFAGEPVGEYIAPIVATVPNYGGRRYWFLCPRCGRRIRSLYGGRYFLCRTCHGLTYATAQAGNNDLQPAIRNRIARIRRRLGADSDPLGRFPDKPRYMHLQTYSRLRREHTDLQVLYLDGIHAELFGSFDMIDQAERDNLRERWRVYKRTGDSPPLWLPDIRPSPYIMQRADNAEDGAEDGGPVGLAAEDQYWADWCRWWERSRPGRRLTLGELATAAGVPYAFAKEAQAEGLIRPDGGRGTRVRRYRPKLATWLGKLHRYRADGMEWEAIRDWTRRRWLPGHDHERQEPGDQQSAISPPHRIRTIDPANPHPHPL